MTTKRTLTEHADTIIKQVEYHKEQIENYNNIIKLLQENPKLQEFPLDFFGSNLEVNVNNREELSIVRAVFPGKWDKSVGWHDDGTMKYSIKKDGITIICSNVPPPPNCRVVEEWVDVPARPARRELRKVVKCDKE